MPKDQDKRAQFEQTILPHLDAAYNLARWLISNDQDAEDAVQEAYLRAYKYFSSYQGGNSRAWLLAIVRNTCYTWLQANRAQELTVDLDEELLGAEAEGDDPEQHAQTRADQQTVRRALEGLPAAYRELIVLRELEAMSYKEIASIAGVPMGTVMSRLARARRQLRAGLGQQMREEG